jgi:multiple sugar transport system ATP-binding protein
MVRKAKLYLLDEPLTNLDAKLRLHMRLELRKLQKEIGQTTIFNTPDQLEALTMADRIAVIKNGKVQQYDTSINVYNKPKTTFVADFTGSPGMNLVDCIYEEKNGSAVLVNEGLAFDITENRELVKQKASGNEVVVGIRPADLGVAKERRTKNDIPGEVYVVEPMGFTQIIDFKVGSHVIKIEAPAALKCDLGDKVFVTPNMSKLHVFDKKTGDLIY